MKAMRGMLTGERKSIHNNKGKQGILKRGLQSRTQNVSPNALPKCDGVKGCEGRERRKKFKDVLKSEDGVQLLRITKKSS
jgi:hypothetical protein